MRRHGSGIDDGSAAVCQHVFTCRDVREENAVQVNVDHLQPLLIGHLLCRSVDADACVGVAEIKAAQLTDYLIHHGVDFFLIGAVALNGNHFSSGSFRQLGSGFLCFLEIQVYDRHVCACLRETGCRALADSSCSSGDETFFPVQSHLFNNTHAFLLLKTFFKSLFLIHFVKRLALIG